MTEVFQITPNSDPEIWAMLQPPVTDEAERPCINCDNLGFPECQFMAVGLDLATACELSESWRVNICRLSETMEPRELATSSIK